MRSRPSNVRRARIAVLAGVLGMHAGCAASGMHVWIVDEHRVRLDDETLSWQQFGERVGARVTEATSSGGAPPAVVIHVDPTLGPVGPRVGKSPIDRVIDTLQDAGVRNVSVKR